MALPILSTIGSLLQKVADIPSAILSHVAEAATFPSVTVYWYTIAGYKETPQPEQGRGYLSARGFEARHYHVSRKLFHGSPLVVNGSGSAEKRVARPRVGVAGRGRGFVARSRDNV